MTEAAIAHLPESPSRKKQKKVSVAAREAEAGDGFVDLELKGISLRIPVRGKVPIAAVEAFRVGDNFAGTRAMVGEEQWKVITDAGWTMDDLDELGQKLDEATGNS